MNEALSTRPRILLTNLEGSSTSEEMAQSVQRDLNATHKYETICGARSSVRKHVDFAGARNREPLGET
jgi:hypothetical protein